MPKSLTLVYPDRDGRNGFRVRKKSTPHTMRFAEKQLSAKKHASCVGFCRKKLTPIRKIRVSFSPSIAGAMKLGYVSFFFFFSATLVLFVFSELFCEFLFFF